MQTNDVIVGTFDIQDFIGSKSSLVVFKVIIVLLYVHLTLFFLHIDLIPNFIVFPMMFFEDFDLEHTIEVIDLLAERKFELSLFPVFVVCLLRVDKLFDLYFVSLGILLLLQQGVGVLPDPLHHALGFDYDHATELHGSVFWLDQLFFLVLHAFVFEEPVDFEAAVD